MQLNGFGQGMAHIDLSSGSVELRPVPEEWVRKFVGGRGLGVRYLLENGPEVEPLSPENLLCFMNGPLSGSEANNMAIKGMLLPLLRRGAHAITTAIEHSSVLEPLRWLASLGMG